MTSLVFCGARGGAEMCFSAMKLASLVCVVLGVMCYAKATERRLRLVAAEKCAVDEQEEVAKLEQTEEEDGEGVRLLERHE